MKRVLLVLLVVLFLAVPAYAEEVDWKLKALQLQVEVDKLKANIGNLVNDIKALQQYIKVYQAFAIKKETSDSIKKLKDYQKKIVKNDKSGIEKKNKEIPKKEQ